MNNLANEHRSYLLYNKPFRKKIYRTSSKVFKNGKNWGYMSRWKEHIRDSKDRNYCRLLNNAIRKYGPEKFTVELILECNVDELNNFETIYITEYNTLSPNGYNLTTGGNCCKQSAETLELKKINMIGKNKGKIYNKRTRIRPEDNNLPKYIRSYYDNSGKEGYRISNHPHLKSKSFLSKSLSMEEKLDLAIKYLSSEMVEKS